MIRSLGILDVGDKFGHHVFQGFRIEKIPGPGIGLKETEYAAPEAFNSFPAGLTNLTDGAEIAGIAGFQIQTEGDRDLWSFQNADKILLEKAVARKD